MNENLFRRRVHVARRWPAVILLLCMVLLAPSLRAQEQRPDHSRVPGVVIDYSPASSRQYIGSPSLAVLPNSDYVASHDFFGPATREHQRATSVIIRSTDRGQTWRKISTIDGQFWSTLFVHRGALYLIGTDRHHGSAIIRRSRDGGITWTEPLDSTSGLLRDNGEYHCAPVPVIEHAGRLWRGMERRNPPVGWGYNYNAGMFSVPVEADLLDAKNWTFAEFLPSNTNWLGGQFYAWLEGNAVVARDGRLLDILRADTWGYPEKAAIVSISADGQKTAFDPQSGFIDFPGGAKKFTIRYDPKSDSYWSLATLVPERHRSSKKPAGVRNTLALTSSRDLTNWNVRTILLHDPDTARHGFQYVDWLFDGNDIIAACRTAHEDGVGGARNNHDANYLTFHRWKNFRDLTMADSVTMRELPQARHNLNGFTLVGRDFGIARLENGGKAFSNRAYVWEQLPEPFHGAQYTRTAGGVSATMRVQAERDGVLFAATHEKQGSALHGWRNTGRKFRYTDANRTELTVFERALKAGEELNIPQNGWTGTIIIVPSNAAAR